MTFRTRRSLLAAVGVTFASAGCLTDSSGTGPDGTDTEESTTENPTSTTESPTSTTENRESTTEDDPNTTGDWIEQASNEPDPDLPVSLNNDSSETRTVRVWVVREETGETVFEETRESPGGTEYGMYNLKRADPEGVEAFRVCGELVESDDATATTASEESAVRDCVTLQTNACYGHAHVTVQEDGSLQVIYSIC